MADTVVIFETTDTVFVGPGEDIPVILPATPEPVVYLVDGQTAAVVLPQTTEPVIILEPIGPPGIQGDTGATGATGHAAETGIAFFVGGHMRDAELVFYMPIVADLPLSSVNSKVTCRVGPLVDKVITLTIDTGDFSARTVFGTATFHAGQTLAVLSSFAAPALLNGQNFGAIAPDTADAAFADLGFQFVS